VGTGIEFSFAPNWSVGFVGTKSVTFPAQPTVTPAGVSGTAVGRSDNISQDVDMATIRLN
jgi:outer membrane immunogenic protein